MLHLHSDELRKQCDVPIDEMYIVPHRASCGDASLRRGYTFSSEGERKSMLGVHGRHHRGVVGMVRFPGEPDEPESGLDHIAEAEVRCKEAPSHQAIYVVLITTSNHIGYGVMANITASQGFLA